MLFHMVSISVRQKLSSVELYQKTLNNTKKTMIIKKSTKIRFSKKNEIFRKNSKISKLFLIDRNQFSRARRIFFIC